MDCLLYRNTSVLIFPTVTQCSTPLLSIATVVTSAREEKKSTSLTNRDAVSLSSENVRLPRDGTNELLPGEVVFVLHNHLVSHPLKLIPVSVIAFSNDT